MKRSRDEFIRMVRAGLGLIGLPLNWQPSDQAIIADHARGTTVYRTVWRYRPRARQYEAFVNGGATHAV